MSEQSTVRSDETAAKQRSSGVPGYLICLSVLLSSIGFFINLPLIPLFFIRLAPDNGQFIGAGATVSVAFVVSAIANPIWGRMSDKHGARLMMIRASVALTVVYVLISLCTTPLQLFGVRILNGLASGYIPAAGKMLAATVSEDRKGRAFSLFNMARAGGALIGPGVGGLLATQLGFQAAFLAAGTMSAAAGVIGVVASRGVLSPRSAAASAARESTRPEPQTRGTVLTLLVMLAVVSALSSLLQFTVPLLLTELSSGSGGVEALTGAVFTVSGVVALVVAYPWGTAIDKFGYGRLLIIVQIVAVPLILAGYWLHGIWLVGLLVVAYTALIAEVGSMFSLALMDHVGPDRQGQALGLSNTATQIGVAVGPLAAGAIAALGGSRWSFIMMAAVHVVLLLGFLPLFRRRATVGRPDGAET